VDLARNKEIQLDTLVARENRNISAFHLQHLHSDSREECVALFGRE